MAQDYVPPPQAVPLMPDDDDDDEHDEEENLDAAEDGAGQARADRLALNDFLRLVRGVQRPLQGYRAAPRTNEELVNALKRSGMISSDSVHKAMRVVPRGAFVPRALREEAYIDSPIRVEDHDFNISAPHMHATGLEALDLRRGERVLDVGCGCGFIAAAAAYLVGPEGRVVGIDIKEAAVMMSRESVEGLREQSAEYSGTACIPTFEVFNAFFPNQRHCGQYDKVHVGATCPTGRLPLLRQLLKPSGGRLIVPVGSELRLVTSRADGTFSSKLLSHVRFQDLAVPSDAQIVVHTLEDELAASSRVLVPPSTLAQDTAGLEKGRGKRKANGCLDTSGDTEHVQDVQLQPLKQHIQSWGPPDCVLLGEGWQLPSHRRLLAARCELLRARLSSGMKDAEEGDIRVPDSFSRPSMEALLEYVYSDQLAPGKEPQQLADLLHVASYFGVPRLISQCEAALAEDLLASEPQHAASAAPALLALADDNGLTQLRQVALAFLVDHYSECAQTEAYSALSRTQVDLVASEACRRMERSTTLLKGLAAMAPESQDSRSSSEWW